LTSRANLKLAADLLDRSFRHAQGQADRDVDLGFLLSELDTPLDRAEPTLEFLATRGLIRSATADTLRLTPRGIEVVVGELDLRALPEAPSAGAASPPSQGGATGAVGATRPYRPVVSYVHEGQTFTHPLGWVTVLGRSADADVTLPDPRASKRHVELRYAGDRYLVKDLGSANGTLLNGNYVDLEPLRHGDVLLVGRTEVTYACPEVVPEPTGEPPQDFQSPPRPLLPARDPTARTGGVPAVSLGATPAPVVAVDPRAFAPAPSIAVQIVGAAPGVSTTASTERPTARPIPAAQTGSIPAPRVIREVSERGQMSEPVRIVKGEPATVRVDGPPADPFAAPSSAPQASDLFDRAPNFEEPSPERPRLPPFARSSTASGSSSGVAPRSTGVDLFAAPAPPSAAWSPTTPPDVDLFATAATPGAGGAPDDLFAQTFVRPPQGLVSPLPASIEPRTIEDLLPPEPGNAGALPAPIHDPTARAPGTTPAPRRIDALAAPASATPAPRPTGVLTASAWVDASAATHDALPAVPATEEADRTFTGMSPIVLAPEPELYNDAVLPLEDEIAPGARTSDVASVAAPDFDLDATLPPTPRAALDGQDAVEIETESLDLPSLDAPSLHAPQVDDPDRDPIHVSEIALPEALHPEPAAVPLDTFADAEALPVAGISFPDMPSPGELGAPDPFADLPLQLTPSGAPPLGEALENGAFGEVTPAHDPSELAAAAPLLAVLEAMPEADAVLAESMAVGQVVSHVDFLATLDALADRLRDAGVPDAEVVLAAIGQLRRHPAVRAALT
jgi:pSer/pThr/pTyr-binding forkhead associated (FHA) protein